MKCKKQGGKTTTIRRTTSRIKTKRTNTAAKQINGDRERERKGEQSRSQQWARKMQRARGAHKAAHLLSHRCLQVCVCVSFASSAFSTSNLAFTKFSENIAPSRFFKYR